MEQFANNPVTTLAEALDDTETDVDVTDGSVFPATGNFRVVVDDEIMLVTARSSNTLTVVRGSEGTTPASHDNGADIAQVLTAGALAAFRADNVIAAAIASRPAAGAAGRLFIPTGGLQIQRDTGAVWAGYGPLHRLTQPPAVSAFTWVNQGGATAVDQGGTIYMEAPDSASLQVRALVKSISAPFKLTAAFRCSLNQFNTSGWPQAGILARDSVTGELLAAEISLRNSTEFQQTVSKYASATSFSSAIAAPFRMPRDIIWYQIEDNSTNTFVRASLDGINWQTIFSEASGTFLDIDQIGFHIQTFDGGGTIPNLSLQLLSWLEE